ncbi:TPA: restriction endonuclease subunit S [Streptococcus suis]|nr:restriction endonuclease subunit S [Streptococcus suis]
MPNKDRNIPKRRFKEFENADAWELRKLVNEVLFIGTGKSKFSALEFGKFEILGSTSVIGYDNSYDYEGDFILTARVGANAGELYRHSGKVKISDNTVFIQGDVLDFIFYILQHFDIKKLSFGTGQPLVKASELKELKILMPVSVKERNHVGTFFSTLDRHITLHQRKLDKLKSVKQAYLSEMFPAEGERVPKRRFPGFTDDWELRKLGEVAEINPKSQIPEKFEYVDLESVVGTSLISHRTVRAESAPSRAQRLALPGDIFYQTVRPYQKNNYLFDLSDDNYVFSTGYAQLRPKIDDRYLMIKIQDDGFVKEVLDRCTGTSYPAINSKDLSQISIDVPTSLPEQEAIGTFFSTLDRHITLHQRKLEKLKNLKKALLNELFV